MAIRIFAASPLVSVGPALAAPPGRRRPGPPPFRWESRRPTPALSPGASKHGGEPVRAAAGSNGDPMLLVRRQQERLCPVGHPWRAAGWRQICRKYLENVRETRRRSPSLTEVRARCGRGPSARRGGCRAGGERPAARNQPRSSLRAVAAGPAATRRIGPSFRGGAPVCFDHGPGVSRNSTVRECGPILQSAPDAKATGLPGCRTCRRCYCSCGLVAGRDSPYTLYWHAHFGSLPAGPS
jgi:hypothetical protein